MNNKISDFPQYRKFTNGKHFYKILSERSFEEIQLVGQRIHSFTFEAKKYPEIIRIQEMLENQSIFPMSSENEWTKMKKTKE